MKRTKKYWNDLREGHIMGIITSKDVVLSKFTGQEMGMHLEE